MKAEKILRGLILVGLFLVPFIPLIVTSSMFFPYITGKNFAFRIIVEIVFALWLVLIWKDASCRPKKSWVLWSVLGWLGVVAVATVLGENPFRSFWSNFERMEGLITYVHLAMYFLVAGTVLYSAKIWHWLFNANLAATLILFIAGLSQHLSQLKSGNFARIDATLGNPSYLGLYMLLMAFFTVFAVYKVWGNKLLRWAYTLCLVGEVYIIYYTATRGAILGLVGGLLLIALILAWRGQGLTKKIALGVVIAGVVLAGIFWSVRQADFVKNSPVLSRFANFSLTEQTTESRLLIWKMSFEGFKEHPVLGWGPENYNLVFNKYYNPLMWKQEPWFDRSHNIVFDWLINAGLLGLLTYLSLFAGALYVIWRKEAINKEGEEIPLLGKALLTGLLAAYFFNNIFVFDNIVSYIIFFTLLAYLYHIEVKGNLNVPVKQVISENRELLGYLLYTVVLVVGVFSLYYFNLSTIVSNQKLIRALSVQGELQKDPRALKIAYDSFTQVLGKNGLGASEAREQLMQYSLGLISRSDIPFNPNDPNDMKIAFVRLADTELKRQVEMTPRDARYQLFYGSFLASLRQVDPALVYLNEAHKLSPGKQAILFQIGSVLIVKKDFAGALSVFKQAYESEPNYEEARKLYALVALYAGQKDLSAKLLTEKYGQSIIPDPRYVDYYYGAGQLGEIERMKALYPQSSTEISNRVKTLSAQPQGSL
ncbi:MAG: O-antigen ligase family protein [bacterium]